MESIRVFFFLAHVTTLEAYGLRAGDFEFPTKHFFFAGKDFQPGSFSFGVFQGSLNYQFWGDQCKSRLILRDFPYNSALFGLVI